MNTKAANRELAIARIWIWVSLVASRWANYCNGKARANVARARRLIA